MCAAGPGYFCKATFAFSTAMTLAFGRVKSLMLVKTPAGAGGAAVVLIERWFSSGAAALASWCSVGAAVVFLVQRWCSSGAAAVA